MESLELPLTFAAGAALLGAGLALGRGCRPATRAMLATLLGLAAVLAARWMLTTPTFVHASLHGPRLLNAAYDAPLSNFRNYGHLGGLAAGLVMRGFGADLTVVAALHQLLSVITLGVMGWVAWRWTGARAAGVCVVAVAALNPVLIRQGASEDGHPLAVLLAWLAIAAMERHARDGRRAALVASAAAAVLMLQTRQIMLAFVPVILVLGLLRTGRGIRQPPAFWIAAAVPLGAGLLRLVVASQQSDQAGHLASVWTRLASIDALSLALARNPIVDLPRFAIHLLPLYLAGAVWLWRDSPAGRGMVGAALWLFVSSLWIYEGQNVAFMFRMPALTVWLFVAGLGAWRSAEWLRRRAPRLPAGALYAAVVAVLCLAPTLQPGWAILRERRPLIREYEYVRSMVAQLPRRFTLVSDVPRGAGVPAYEFPYHLLADAGVQVHGSADEGPRLFLNGVFCRSYSLVELLDAAHGYDLFTGPHRDRIFDAFGRTDSQGFAVPAEERPECRRLLEGATPLGTPLRIPAAPHDPPFVMFGVDAFDIQFYELPSAAAPAP